MIVCRNTLSQGDRKSVDKDISYGVIGPGFATPQYFTQPTPGAANIATTMEVVASSPSDGELVFPAPSEIQLDFSRPVLATSVDAGDLLIDGQAAADVSIFDADTIRFTPTSPLGAGPHTISMADSAVVR